MLENRNCVVCDSPFVCYLMDVPTRWTKRNIPLFYCMKCRSFFNPSGQKDSEGSYKSSLDWCLSVADRNRNWSNMLLDQLEKRGSFKSIIEIGCGIGTLLETAKQRRIKVIGFDTNPYAVRYGIEQLGIELRTGYWDSGVIDSKYDLVISISVLEHLEHPRPLMKDIADYCQQHSSSAFISVPFLDYDRWHYLFDPDPLREGTPFFDNDAHVTHFSRQGFVEMCKEFGSKSEIPVGGGGWNGYLVEF